MKEWRKNPGRLKSVRVNQMTLLDHARSMGWEPWKPLQDMTLHNARSREWESGQGMKQVLEETLRTRF